MSTLLFSLDRKGSCAGAKGAGASAGRARGGQRARRAVTSQGGSPAVAWAAFSRGVRASEGSGCMRPVKDPGGHSQTTSCAIAL